MAGWDMKSLEPLRSIVLCFAIVAWAAAAAKADADTKRAAAAAEADADPCGSPGRSAEPQSFSLVAEPQCFNIADGDLNEDELLPVDCYSSASEYLHAKCKTKKKQGSQQSQTE